MTNVPVSLLSELSPRKIEEKPKFRSFKRPNLKTKTSSQQQQQQQSKAEEAKNEKEAKNPKPPRQTEADASPPQCKIRTKLHDADLSSEDREEKMIRICLTDPKWISVAQSYQKIRSNGVDVNLMTFLRGILTPSQFREINEKCFPEKTKHLY